MKSLPQTITLVLKTEEIYPKWIMDYHLSGEIYNGVKIIAIAEEDCLRSLEFAEEIIEDLEQELKDTRLELKRKKRELDVANVKLKKYRNFTKSVRGRIIENLNHEAHQLDEEIKEITISSKRYVQE